MEGKQTFGFSCLKRPASRIEVGFFFVIRECGVGEVEEGWQNVCVCVKQSKY